MSDAIAKWLAARSLARGLPAPVPHRGGYRVDTHTPAEICRWVFPRVSDGLRSLAQEIDAPFYALKLCGEARDLRAAVPARWDVEAGKYVMESDGVVRPAPLPDGYTLDVYTDGAVTQVHVRAADGELAASGYAAEAEGVFVYDRIGTAAAHRRLGLGRVVMGALGEARRSAASRPMLVATEEGRALYLSLAWVVTSPFATALIAEGQV